MKKHSKILCLALSLLMVLSLLPATVFAAGIGDPIATPITIKPKDVVGEFISQKEVIYKASELEYVGEGRLNEGDVFADVVYSGERRYAGESESTITSYKIMRGDVDVTSLYTNVTKKPGKIEVNPFSLPQLSFEINVPVNTVFTTEDIKALLGMDLSNFWLDSFTGVGSFSNKFQYYAPATTGTAELGMAEPAKDLNGDGIDDVSVFRVNISVTVIDSAVAKSTGGYYETLQKAINAAENGDTITLVGDKDTKVEETVTIPSDKQITIDLNDREIYVYDEDTQQNLYGITNYGELTLEDSSADKDGWAWMIDNYGKLTVNNGEIYELKNNTDGEVVINEGRHNYIYNDGSIDVKGGMFLRGDPLAYVDENGLVVEVDISVELSQYIKPWIHYYAVNDSIEVYERDMAYVDRAKEGDANFNILKAPDGAELNIDNLHPDLLINNETDSAVILNGRFLEPGVKGKKLAELPVAYKISVTNGTARIDSVERYWALEGETVQLHSSGAPDGQEFDKWEITGMDITGLDLTSGVLTFTMPAADITATATYKNVSVTPAVTITEGNGSEWTKGTTVDLTFKSNANFADFVSVEIDGNEVAASNYTVVEGSIKVTLKAAYLETLSVGKHTIVIASATGRPEAEFTVKAAAGGTSVDVPKTGDNSNMFLWIALLAASACGLASTLVISKRKRAK